VIFLNIHVLTDQKARRPLSLAFPLPGIDWSNVQALTNLQPA
jgi:hypothetical protein